MTRYLWLAAALASAVTTGCVDRHFIVTSEVPGLPPGQDAGSMVYINGEEKGPTPLDVYYTYYGKYHIVLVHDGCETLQVDQQISTPWYEWFPLDFFSETVWPFKIRDEREFHYALQPVREQRPEDVLSRGSALRDQGLRVVPLPNAIPSLPKQAQPPKPGATQPETTSPPGGRVVSPATGS